MNRREFLAGVGAATATALAGCINSAQEFGFDDSVNVREGTISLTETRASKTLFTQPSDTPRNILGVEDSQYIVFVFDTSELDVKNTRKHDYLRDFLQYRLSSDTVAPIVSTEPSRTENEDDATSVGFRVPAPFQPTETRLQWLGDTNAVWRAETVLSEHTSFLNNPPRFVVESLSVDRTTGQATISATVLNDGGSTGEFKAIVRGDETTYVDQPIQSGKTRQVNATVAVDDPEQAIVISWGVDQATTPFTRN